MELKIRDGDYCPDGLGGMERLSDAEAVLQRVLYRLTARKGSFPLLPKLGSDLHRLLREKPSTRQAMAEQYVHAALAEESVKVQTVVLEQQTHHLWLVVEVLWQGKLLSVTAELGGGFDV